MPIPPKPVFLNCNKCKFKKIVAPRSDFVPKIYASSNCPNCGVRLQRIYLPNFVRNITKMFN